MNGARAILIAGQSATIARAADAWVRTYRRPAGRRTESIRRSPAMTAQTLPDEPNFCFVPAYDSALQPAQH